MIELPDGWRDQLPEDIRSNGVLDDVKSIDQMATMIVNGRKLQTNQISIPSADAAPEKRDEFLKDLQTKIPDLVYVGEGADMDTIHGRLGRPNEASEYKLPEIPDPLKDNFAGLTAKAFELGMTDNQMKGISEAILSDYTTNMDKATNAMHEQQSSLKQAYGDAYEQNVKGAADFAKKVGFDEQLVGAISEGGIGVENMKAFEVLMDGFKSHGPRIGDNEGSEFGHMTPEQAELQLTDIMSNKEHAYWNGADPAHDAAIKKVLDLTRSADAGKVQSDADKFRDALAGRS